MTDQINTRKGSILTLVKNSIAELMGSQSINNAVTVSRTDDKSQLINLFGPRSAAGFAVNETTAMRVSAVFACVRLIAGSVASLPLMIYERTDEGRKEASIHDQGLNDLWFLLNEQPYTTYTAASFWEWIAKCNQLRGDGYARIVRTRLGTVKQLEPLHPDRVRQETVAGRLQYYVQPLNGNPYGLDQDDMLHFPGFGFDGESSMSVIQYSAFQSIGIALAADDMSGKFYANGASPKHLFETASAMSPDLIQSLRDQYAEKYAGPENSGKPMVLTEGLTVKDLSMSAVDAQLLDSRKYQVIDIARAFGVPPHMIAAQESTSSWGAGIEQQTLGYIKFALQPYLNRYQQEINRKLFPESSKYFVKFDLDELVAGDSDAESKALREARGGSQGPGWMTLNEIRRKKNLPPLSKEDGGESVYIPKGSSNEKPPAAAN